MKSSEALSKSSDPLIRQLRNLQKFEEIKKIKKESPLPKKDDSGKLSSIASFRFDDESETQSDVEKSEDSVSSC